MKCLRLNRHIAKLFNQSIITILPALNESQFQLSPLGTMEPYFLNISCNKNGIFCCLKTRFFYSW